jgi:two-component system response regulator AtoC
LLVEDDAELREILQRALQRGGCRVTAAATANSAAEAARGQDFAVAVVDRGLAGDDGLALMQRLLDLQADLQVVVLSGRCDEESVACAKALGAFAYLTKPCRLSELKNTVECAYRTGRACTAVSI